MEQAETDARAQVEPTAEELRHAYRVAVRSRAAEEFVVRLVNRGEIKFAIWGTGEEVHGVATALALAHALGRDDFGFVPHYRSYALVSMWLELQGYEDFVTDLMRQQFSRDTDELSRGRQMVNHLYYPELGILPLQSPVGMQLDKTAGYAMGYKIKGREQCVAMAIIGDGTTAEGDLHNAMTAASVWRLPLIIMVADNNVAISTLPEEGQGIKDYAAYARSFDLAHFECDGRDFWDVYSTTIDVAGYVRDKQGGVVLHVKHLPRLNGHSSAADVTFDLSQDDPLIEFGEQLVDRDVLEKPDVLRRKQAEGRDFFAHHEPGRIMEAEMEQVRALIKQVRAEPEPSPDSLFEHVYRPFPEVTEPVASGTTNITYAGAVRSALDRIIDRHGGVLWGQDVARLGGVMQATAGLKERHPDRVLDAPLNEPLIVGTAMGASLHPDLVALPEIQFGDYSFNAFHWLVHLGNFHWASNGKASASVILRMPTDPFGGGAIYHSMSCEGYFSSIPGLVLLMPSTSFDAYGLLMTAAEYGGPVVVLEPKFAYRLPLGPALPGEPTDEGEIEQLKRDVMRGGIPQIDPSLRVPFSKAAVRRRGSDVTVVAWGRAVFKALDAAAMLAENGIEAEVIDLRTLVPPDLDAVHTSVGRTGRLVVAAEDRPFAGFVRSIQGHAVERLPGLPTRAVGQKNIPGIPQSLRLEKISVLSADDVVKACEEVTAVQGAASSGGRSFAWMPRRYYEG
ncbi:MAG TPA: thiamine pyrophosphate-dependent enzyme [Acidobacteriota bacterium]|nr:thiamine pyrophosphate-dependent enzyme [Acidobacteriota bacterium]